MKKIFLILLFAIQIFASLDFGKFYNKEIEILRSLDVDTSFIANKDFIAIKKEFKKYKKSHFFNTKSDSFIYIPTIKRLISEAKIPQVFLFMAMAESNFSLHAKSNKKAIGIWQFMPQTAKKYGLRIDEYVDERKDPVKSTKAAIKYLKYLHKKFGRWYLAALAYNSGEGRVIRAIKRAKTKDLNVLIDPKKRYLPKESRRYIRKIIALALIGNDENYFLKSDFDYILNRGSAYSLAIVKAKGGDVIDDIAKNIRIKSSILRELNAHLKYGFVPPYAKNYDIYIPYIKLADFKENYKPSNIKKAFIIYKVKKGDSLAKIANKYEISYKMIKDFNKLKSNILKINQTLIIPIPKKSKIVYRVKKGDTLLSISKRYGITVAKLKKLNDKKNHLIRVGEKLVIIN
ncbi:transglycosylase SLT domain-containing protein [Nitrosophilus kaiyonis]|uniref:LysM peptidoglycan-binding domain-containing protein n=1 Tax=Nitrosophilus kaiyonis TaxID=2930200 RepID=UPI0024916B32|nr:transglycosylase SLT domain-containing protein [Nitrosophilus kaiyonis]